MKPIWMCLDNDSLRRLPGSDALRMFWSEVHQPPPQRRVIFCYSYPSFMELLVGTKPENLAEHQSMLRVADQLCGPGRGAYLPAPALHLALWLQPPEQSADRAGEIRLLDTMIQRLIGAVDFAEFEAVLGPMQRGVTEALDQTQAAMSAAVRERRSRITGYDDARVRFAREVSAASLLAGNRRAILMMYDLLVTFDGKTEDEVLCASPGIRYYLELERAYLDRYYFEDIDPRPEDVFRKQQGVYLDGCDYLVTEDLWYQRLLGRYELEDLAGRAVPTDQVVKHLRRPTLPKRTRA